MVKPFRNYYAQPGFGAYTNICVLESISKVYFTIHEVDYIRPDARLFAYDEPNLAGGFTYRFYTKIV